MRPTGFGSPPTNAATSNANTFLADYVRQVRRNDASGVLATWLFRNAIHMKEDAFSRPDAPWLELEPQHVLVLRAIAPSGVFTPRVRKKYLAQVEADPKLTEIADAIFSDDFGFFLRLPEEWKKLQPRLIELMLEAYRRGIRAPDGKVRSM